MTKIPDTIPENVSELRRLVYAESELNAYNHLESSVKGDHFKLYDNRSESNETNSMISGRTSNYSATDIHQHTHIKKPNNIRTIRAQKSQELPQHMRMDSKFSNLSTTSIRTIESTTKLNPDVFEKQDPQKKRLYGSTLAKTLHDRRIRESVEMDPFHSMQSNGASYPPARLSEIAKQSVITLRMIGGRQQKQIRLKLYLPLTGNRNDKNPPQIIMLFVNNGSPMVSVKRFLEDNYPNKVLKGKIRNLCVADDDGDIDDDFPPIPNDGDITALGVQNLWVDRIFEKQNKSLVIHSEEDMTTFREYPETKNSSSYYSNVENEKSCCWCCWLKMDDDDDDEDETNYRLSYSDYQTLVLKEKRTKENNHDYEPPNIANGNNENNANVSGTKTNVQYANL